MVVEPRIRKVLAVDSDGTIVSSPITGYNINHTDDNGNDSNPNYYGFEDSSGKWYIMKEDKSAVPNVYTYAKGASAYGTAWTGRAGHSYAIFGSTF